MDYYSNITSINDSDIIYDSKNYDIFTQRS